MTEIDLATIDQIVLGHTVALVRVGEGGGIVTIEGDFTVRRGDEEVHVAPEALADGGAVLLGLLHQPVHAATVEEDGSLRLEIGEAVVTVPPSAHFEAWNYVADDGRRVVCMPGGRLAVWPEN